MHFIADLSVSDNFKLNVCSLTAANIFYCERIRSRLAAVNNYSLCLRLSETLKSAIKCIKFFVAYQYPLYVTPFVTDVT